MYAPGQPSITSRPQGIAVPIFHIPCSAITSARCPPQLDIVCAAGMEGASSPYVTFMGEDPFSPVVDSYSNMTKPMYESPTSFPTYNLPFSAPTTHPSELNCLMWKSERMHVYTEGHTRRASAVPAPLSGPTTNGKKIHCSSPSQTYESLLQVLSL